jgi:CRISPR-associated protein Cmr1
MRKQPASTPPVINTNQYQQARAEQICTQVRAYRLITPLFGGGVLPAEADPVTIIRGSEIRGHLRFWWRACRGGQFNNDLQRMKEVEDKIWGAASKRETDKQHDSEEHQQQQTDKQQLEYKQSVQIEVKAKKPEDKDYVSPFIESDYNTASEVPKYLAFPLEKIQRPVCKNITFTLTISFPKEYQKDVEAALWAWETFGGLGARTRRGFGALRLLTINQRAVTDLPPSANFNHVREWIKYKLAYHVIAGSLPPGVPQLSPHTLFGFTQRRESAEDVWKDLANTLRRFRQAAQKQDKQKWTGLKEVKQIVQNYPRQPDNTFPKAAFGLPIVYHLDDELDVALQGASDGQERLASPLILRPLQFRDGESLGLALLLTGTHIKDDSNIPPGGLTLKWHGNEPGNNTSKDITVPVRQGQEDILQLFMDKIRPERKQR